MEKPSKREQTRARILEGAGRSFRTHGYGAGVDGVARAAGVTSGAFYAYFNSKAEAFRETVVVGLKDLELAVRQLRAADESTWVERFVNFYLGEKRTCELPESCALQSLTTEVARADVETRQAYEAELRAVVRATAEGMDAPTATARRRQAIVMLALVSGGVSLARAVNDPAFSLEIANAIRSSLLEPAPREPTRPSATKTVRARRK
ncbi:MAG: TetR family transcriptional regulator [Myxococcaceae bacterium]|nr:TetR family transcriptional regulator [Myxococcaceae bacterium]